MKHLRTVDALIIGFMALMSVIYFGVVGSAPGAYLLLGVNLVIGVLIMAAGRGAARSDSAVLNIIRDFYPAVMIYVVFKEVHLVIQTMQRVDFDPVFIGIDRWLFGTDPTVWLSRFAHPALTEFMQLSYTSYYFILLALGVALYRKDHRGVFPIAVFTITYGFFLSYLGYMLWPGVGPRFTLHDFASLDLDLPGVWLTEGLRIVINAGESIPPGAANPYALAQRDVFPSGHTQMTLLAMYFAHRYRIRSRYVFDVIGILIIISTVYLRYHYAIDLVAGALFAAATIGTAPLLMRWWEKITVRIPA